MFGCAQLLDMGSSPDGLRVAEVAAFTIAADYRGGGRGDSLLDYVEQRARSDVRPVCLPGGSGPAPPVLLVTISPVVLISVFLRFPKSVLPAWCFV